MGKIILDATVWLNFARGDSVERLVHGLAGRLAVGILVERQELRYWPAKSSRKGEAFSLDEFVTSGALERTEMTAEEMATFGGTRSRFRLGHGETEALVIASQRGWMLATDDAAARKILNSYSPPVRLTGTLGLLKELIEKGALNRKEATELLSLMQSRGGWLPTIQF